MEMETFVARALINRLLNESEIKRLKEFEEDLQTKLDSAGRHQRGRYLAGFEVCRLFNLKPNPVLDADSQRMHSLYWIWRQKQDEIVDKDREGTEGHANKYE